MKIVEIWNQSKVSHTSLKIVSLSLNDSLRSEKYRYADSCLTNSHFMDN